MDGGASGYNTIIIFQLIGWLQGLSPANEVTRCAAPESAAEHIEKATSFLRARRHQHRNLILVRNLYLYKNTNYISILNILGPHKRFSDAQTNVSFEQVKTQAVFKLQLH